MISEIIEKLEPSPTLALAARAKELQSQGEDVISLTVGEPDWPTYKVIKERGCEAIRDDKTKYTPASGERKLREVIAQKQTQWTGVPYDFSSVTVTSGAKFILFSALFSTVDPGDEVLIPDPYWVSYPAMVEMCRAVPKFLRTGPESQFKVTAESLSKALTAKTKVFLFNSPSNPTGMVYTEEELRAVAEVLRQHPRVLILSDDIYNQLMLKEGEDLSPHLLQVAPDLKDRVISVNGVSKAYAMTGWRLGWAVAPKNIAEAMTNFQSQALGCASSISQHAALTALTETDADLRLARENLKRRYSLALELFQPLEGLEVFPPDAAFYLWIGIQGLLGKSYRGQKITGSRDFCRLLLEEEKVAVVPGLEFGCEGYFRMSFAVTEKNLRRSSERLARFLSEIA